METRRIDAGRQEVFVAEGTLLGSPGNALLERVPQHPAS
jgi:hypothetical protein